MICNFHEVTNPSLSRHVAAVEFKMSQESPDQKFYTT